MKDTIYKAASATLEVTNPGKRYINRDTWLWNDDVQIKVPRNQHLYRKFLEDKTLGSWKIYKNANLEAEKVITVPRVIDCKDADNKLDTREGRRDLYQAVKDRCREYFQQISMEFVHPPLPQT